MFWLKNTAFVAKQCICVLLTLSSFILSCYAEVCTTDTKDRCICTTSNYQIDLNPIVKGQTKPAMKDQKALNPLDLNWYSLQVCKPAFDEGTGCKNVAACQKVNDQTQYSLGTHENASFSGDPEKNTLLLTFGTGERTAYVNLRCDEKIEADYVVYGELEDKKTHYNFTVTSKYVCLKNLEQKNGLSTGSILVILFFVLAFVYIVGGILFLRFVRGARGVEQVPNHEFWSDFPLLIRDGVAFLLRGCKTDAVYEQI